jgi:hypothetical protein
VSIGSRADALERALGAPRAAAPAGRAGEDAELRRLVETAEALRALPVRPPGPRPEFREALRDRLVEEAALVRGTRSVGGAPVPGQRRQRPAGDGRRRVRRVVAAAVAVSLLGGTGAALASSTALPGQTLYPLKRGVEDVRLAVAGSDAARGATELDLARTRLDEAERLLVAEGGGSPEPARRSLEEFSSTALSGVRLLLRAYDAEDDEAHLREVTTFLDATLPRLQRLQAEAPDGLDPAIARLVGDLGSLQARLDQVLAACDGPCSAPGQAGTAQDAPAPDARPLPGAAAAPAPVASGSAVPVPPAVTGAAGPPPAGVQVGDEAGVSAGSGGVAASLPGAGVQLPATSASAPGAVLPAPTVTLGEIPATAPGVTVDPGGLLAPGCTIDLSGTCLP